MSPAEGAGSGEWIVLLTLGSNIEPEANLLAALDALGRIMRLDAVSAVYEGEPVGAPGTPPFLNAAVRARTDRSPATLKNEVLRPLEARLGRVRGPDPNAPRTIDIDLAGVVTRRPGTAEDALEALDPDIPSLAHLALPLADVGPDLTHPAEGVSLARIAERFRDEPGIARRDDLRWPRP